MSSGVVYINQGRCANFDHDDDYVYYYATNRRDKVWSGAEHLCIGAGHSYDIFLSSGGSCTYGTRGFIKAYARDSQAELRD
jgi:hypothetical protein